MLYPGEAVSFHVANPYEPTQTEWFNPDMTPHTLRPHGFARNALDACALGLRWEAHASHVDSFS